MLTIIARPTVAPERVEELKRAMLDLVAKTVREQGCLRYELHQDNDQPNKFIFVECWENRELWQQHMNGAALESFKQKYWGGIVDFELQELQKIS